MVIYNVKRVKEIFVRFGIMARDGSVQSDIVIRLMDIVMIDCHDEIISVDTGNGKRREYQLFDEDYQRLMQILEQNVV